MTHPAAVCSRTTKELEDGCSLDRRRTGIGSQHGAARRPADWGVNPPVADGRHRSAAFRALRVVAALEGVSFALLLVYSVLKRT